MSFFVQYTVKCNGLIGKRGEYFTNAVNTYPFSSLSRIFYILDAAMPIKLEVIPHNRGVGDAEATVAMASPLFDP